MLASEPSQASLEKRLSSSDQVRAILCGLSRERIGSVKGDALERVSLGVNETEWEPLSLSELLDAIDRQPQATLKLTTVNHRSAWLTLVPGRSHVVAAIQATDNDLLLTTLSIVETCSGHDG
jgi:hypothetical protein